MFWKCDEEEEEDDEGAVSFCFSDLVMVLAHVKCSL